MTHRSSTGALLVAACLVLAGCGGSSKPKHVAVVTSPAVPRLAFGYTETRNAGLADHGLVGHEGSVSLRDVSYVSGADRVDAFLVEPPGGGWRPAIVVVHGSGGDRRDLLPAAVALAQQGMVALAITAPSSAHPPARTAGPSAYLAQAKATVVRDVVAVRAAADALGSLKVVDPKRIGYLGWSAGAKTGAFVAASDKRFKALALLSAGADKVSLFTTQVPAQLRGLVTRGLGSVDPLRYVARAAPGTLLLEDGTKDQVVPHRALLNMAQAAPRGTVVLWYPTGHELNNAAYRYAFTWLARKLHAAGPR